MHLDYSGVLRCILSLNKPGSEIKCHILVFVIRDSDQLYTVINFPEHLQEALEDDIDLNQKTQLNYDLEISRTINSIERTLPGSALASLMINEDFHCSYLIFANEETRVSKRGE